MATSSRGSENEACSEIFALLMELGDKNPSIRKAKPTGIIIVRTSVDPANLVTMLRAMVAADSSRAKYLLRIIPVEKVVKTSTTEIVEAVKSLSGKIAQGESFRVTVEKRFSNISTKELISSVAGVIDRKVELEDPSWTVLLEVIGNETGVSILQPNQILSISKEKMR